MRHCKLPLLVLAAVLLLTACPKDKTLRIIAETIVAVQEGTIDVKVSTFNILADSKDDTHTDVVDWDDRKDSVVSFIKDRNSDIVGLQEVEEAQNDYLKSGLSDEYGSFGEGREYLYCKFNCLYYLAGGEDGEATPIFYKTERFSLVNSGHYMFSGDYHRIVTWVLLKEKGTNKYTYVYNTHYLWGGSGESNQAIAREVRADYSRQLSRWIESRGEIDGHKPPFLIMGDFNSLESDESIQLLRDELGLVDVHRSVYPQPDAARDSTKSVGSSRIDYILASHNSLPISSVNRMQSNESDGKTYYLSDHKMVIGRVMVNLNSSRQE